MPFARLAAYDGVAAFAGAASWIALGAKMGPALERTHAIVDIARPTLVAVVLVLAALALRRQRSGTKEATSVRGVDHCTRQDSSLSKPDESGKSVVARMAGRGIAVTTRS